DAAVEQRFFDFACEQAFSANLVQRGIGYSVARCFDHFDTGFETAGVEPVPDVVRLPHRKLRAPGPNDQHTHSVIIRAARFELLALAAEVFVPLQIAGGGADADDI